MLHEVAGGWQLRTSPDNSDFARRFLRVKPQRLTRAALETLAIVAYRQPVTRPEIEEIRGVDCGAVVKALLERRLVKILGKKEEPGRPILYGTTREFLEFFALKDLASLPTLREFHELSEEHREIVEKAARSRSPSRSRGSWTSCATTRPAGRARGEARGGRRGARGARAGHRPTPTRAPRAAEAALDREAADGRGAGGAEPRAREATDGTSASRSSSPPPGVASRRKAEELILAGPGEGERQDR